MEKFKYEFTPKPGYNYFPGALVQLPFGGQAQIAVTAGDHISFDVNHHSAGDSEDACYIVLKGGQQYSAHISLGPGPDGVFVVKQEHKNPATKRKYFKVFGSDAPRTHQEQIEAIATECVNAYVQQFPHILKEQAAARLQEKIDATRVRLQKALAEVDVVRAEYKALLAEQNRQYQAE